MNYQDADKLLQGKCSLSRKIDNNTYLIRENDVFRVKLHDTYIITYFPDGSIGLSSGGWKTHTTKARINKYLSNGFSIYLKSSIWYIWNYTTKEKYVYKDGITMHSNGDITGAEKDDKKQDKLNKVILKYSNAYIEALFKGKVPAPSGGDCLFCALDFKGGNEHYLSHFKKHYYVPTIIVKASKAFPVSRAALHELACMWEPDNPKAKSISIWRDKAKQQLRKALQRYLKREFSLAS